MKSDSVIQLFEKGPTFSCSSVLLGILNTVSETIFQSERGIFVPEERFAAV